MRPCNFNTVLQAVKALRSMFRKLIQDQESEDDSDSDIEGEIGLNKILGHLHLLPRMSAQVLFKIACSLELSKTPNCEVNSAHVQGIYENRCWMNALYVTCC